MKSLNDIIWNGDVNLEERKESDVIKSGMNETCLINSCGGYLDPICKIKYSYAPSYACIK